MARELTGRHVLLITTAFFAVIIAVNVFMAYMAISTFPGFEASNTYYASQSFDADRRAMKELNWHVTHEYAEGELRFTLTEANGVTPAKVKEFQVLVGRATERDEDQAPSFARDGATYHTPIALRPGKWVLRMEALAENGKVFRQTREVIVKG